MMLLHCNYVSPSIWGPLNPAMGCMAEYHTHVHTHAYAHTHLSLSSITEKDIYMGMCIDLENNPLLTPEQIFGFNSKVAE